MDSYSASILIVDDQPANLRLLLSCLEKHEFQIRFAENGTDALSELTKSQPDIILLDVMMLGMDGFEICRRIKENKATSQIPIIFLTALADIEDKIAGFEAGGVDYITKPYHQAEVLARLKIQLAMRQREQELEEALAEVKQLSGILSICCRCKQIRNDKGYWQQMEEYIKHHFELTFSHGYCPQCYEAEVKVIEKYNKEMKKCRKNS